MLDCWTGIDFLKTLQELRFSLGQGFTDFMMGMSSIVFYMAIPIIVFFIMYWFVDERKGELCMVNLISAYMLAKFLKYVIREPRPYELDRSIIPAYEETSYSTPSGHTAIATAGYGSLMLAAKNKIVKVAALILLALIVFSRMFLGVHTPLDVILAVLLAIAVMAVNWHLLRLSYESERNYYAIGFGYLVFFVILTISTLAIMDNDEKNVALGSGFLLGLFVSRLIEHRYVGHRIPDCRMRDKIVLGLIGLLVIGAIMGSTYITKVPLIMFAGGFVSMVWGYALFPYLMKNKVSIIGKLMGRWHRRHRTLTACRRSKGHTSEKVGPAKGPV